jgi:hypothetical protein
MVLMRRALVLILDDVAQLSTCRFFFAMEWLDSLFVDLAC